MSRKTGCFATLRFKTKAILYYKIDKRDWFTVFTPLDIFYSSLFICGQVYSGLSIATAKASKEEQAAAQHHLLDCVEPSDPFTVTHFRDMAIPVVSVLFHCKEYIMLLN